MVTVASPDMVGAHLELWCWLVSDVEGWYVLVSLGKRAAETRSKYHITLNNQKIWEMTRRSWVSNVLCLISSLSLVDWIHLWKQKNTMFK